MKMYRYETMLTSAGMRLELRSYDVLKETKCGVRIKLYPWSDKLKDTKFIKLNAKKQWACTTQELAFESFKYRKNRQISILKGQLQTAEYALKLTLEKPFVSILGMYEWD